MSIFGKTDAAISRPKSLKAGQVEATQITNAGSGYTTASVSFTAAPGGGTTATGTVTLSGGKVTGIALTNPGAGYTTAPTPTISGDGTGALATSTIAAIDKKLNLAELFFVDLTEATIDTNKARGITGPGWWKVKSYTDSSGATRYKAQHLISTKATSAAAGDASDDATIADVLATITISAQPTDQTTVSGAATFSVTASVAPSGTLTYQWQSRAGATGRFSDISNATSASLVLSGKVAGDSGTQYRVKIHSTSGATEVISNAVTLTFGN